MRAQTVRLDAHAHAHLPFQIPLIEQLLDLVGFPDRLRCPAHTLCKYEGSFLEAMFSGRHATKRAADGSFFIDRDPTHFRMVLNWLRTGAAITPESPAARAEAAADEDVAQLGRGVEHVLAQRLGGELAPHGSRCVRRFFCDTRSKRFSVPTLAALKV